MFILWDFPHNANPDGFCIVPCEVPRTVKDYNNLGKRNLIGPVIRRLRNAMQLSQAAFAAELQRKGWDVSRDMIASLEAQTRRVADYEFLLLARALRVQVAELFPHRSEAEALKFADRLTRRMG